MATSNQILELLSEEGISTELTLKEISDRLNKKLSTVSMAAKKLSSENMVILERRKTIEGKSRFKTYIKSISKDIKLPKLNSNFEVQKEFEVQKSTQKPKELETPIYQEPSEPIQIQQKQFVFKIELENHYEQSIFESMELGIIYTSKQLEQRTGIDHRRVLQAFKETLIPNQIVVGIGRSHSSKRSYKRIK